MKNNLLLCSKLIRFFVVTMVGFLLTQCEHGDKLTPASSTITSPLTISSEYALKVVSAFNNYPQNKKARMAATDKAVDDQDSLIIKTTETYSDDGKQIFHILNYKNNKGWIIISADRRVSPILAYSYTGQFDVKNLGDGPKTWVEGVAKISKKAQSSELVPTDMVEARWKYYEKNMKKSNPNGRVADSNCSSYDQYMHQCPANTTYASLGYPNTLVGSWGSDWQQYFGYTYSMPVMSGFVSSCAQCNNNNQLTGCGPLAMAMLCWPTIGINQPQNQVATVSK